MSPSPEDQPLVGESAPTVYVREPFEPFDDDDGYEDDEDFEPALLWTRHRVLTIIVVLILLITLLAYSFQGIFYPTSPLPPRCRAPVQ